MKTFALAAALAVAVLLSVGQEASAAPPTTPKVHKEKHTFTGGVQLGADATSAINGLLPFSATVDFTSSAAGVAYSGNITVAGAAVNDSCTLGPPAAAAALLGTYGCVVTAADTVKAWFKPGSDSMLATCTLNGATPSVCTVTVVASSVCTCSPVGATAAIAAGGCAVGVSGTTLTVTSAAGLTNVVNTFCKAPVDPVSSTFEGFVTKH